LVGSLEEQFRNIFETNDIGEKISARKLDGLLSDGKLIGEIYTGDLYREDKLKKFLLEEGNFSVTVNTDSVKIFHSSKFSVWPLLLSINELNFDEKSKHIVICCLWFGNAKPNVDTFLEPFIIQARRLSHKGFQWKDSSGRIHISKVAFPLLVSDGPARAMLTNSCSTMAFMVVDFVNMRVNVCLRVMALFKCILLSILCLLTEHTVNRKNHPKLQPFHSANMLAE
jgi:hypothetical protein